MLLETHFVDYYRNLNPDGLFSSSGNPTYVFGLRTTLRALQLDGMLNINQLTEPKENSIVRDKDKEFQTMRHVILLLAM